MHNFIYGNPTKIMFGENQLSDFFTQIQQYGSRFLFVYGQSSLTNSELYQQIRNEAEKCNIELIDHGGVTGNPLLSHGRDGVIKVKAEKVDAILAVGGIIIIICASLTEIFNREWKGQISNVKEEISA